MSTATQANILIADDDLQSSLTNQVNSLNSWKPPHPRNRMFKDSKQRGKLLTN